MPTQLLITRFLNAHLAGPTTSLLHTFHVQPVDPAAPITNAFAMELLVFAVLLVYFIDRARHARSGKARRRPAPRRDDPRVRLASKRNSIIGHGYERFAGYLTALGLFILLGNLMGLVPGLESPTANVVVPLGFALVTFIYYHYHGIRSNGFVYIKQFLGPVWWLYPLLSPIEIISHFARVLSLTVRLYANMFAGDLVTLAFFSLIPIGVPLIFLALHFGVAIIQAYVFMLLATIYLSLAVAHDH